MNNNALKIQRVQTGVRIETRLLAVLNDIASRNKANLGQLIEDMVLHAFEGSGACAFRNPPELKPLPPTQDSGAAPDAPTDVHRSQAGFKIEKRLLKVLSGIAQHAECTLGQLLERIARHQLIGADVFPAAYIAKVVTPLKSIYGLDVATHDNARFEEVTDL